jgi:hypothetical protein
VIADEHLPLNNIFDNNSANNTIDAQDFDVETYEEPYIKDDLENWREY